MQSSPNSGRSWRRAPRQVITSHGSAGSALPSRVKRNAWWAAQLRFSYEYGTDPAQVVDPGPLSRVSAESIHGDANLLIRLDNYVQVTLLPRVRGRRRWTWIGNPAGGSFRVPRPSQVI